MKPDKDVIINSINLNAETDFPYLMVDVMNERSYPRNPGFQVIHWYEDLQFIYVLEGNIEVKTLDTAVKLKVGEGIFINKNVVHLVSKVGTCHYNSFIFPDYFLKFYQGSPAENIVTSISGKSQLPVYHLTPGKDWHNTALDCLKQLVILGKNKTDFYAYEVLIILSKLWLCMAQNISLPPVCNGSVVNERMQTFLWYIQNHYAEVISLEQLAKSANVSKSECLRCFKTSMQTTPYRYLMEFRLSKAVDLLQNTAEPIGNIANMVGFHQMSHFGKCFKEKIGCSPREYRGTASETEKKHAKDF
ncbi:helix-turn-helix transcriptional regulator [Bacillus sp. ISL-4]|uniref:AraC family transcriptional regulator n=1 Tax=Bacillus sp. ISL-4 TaxID=2819125 RepID=UPI001BE503A5|nr:AraC family transcriptional regulator [Bacillus sp. ISL-4]MBT2666765.1 helix-turn-helix transcriptional regulator [Bacillus sp. ISL-4]MBT2672390.1 helix-turn-helix transcriptional regulator [Streptomyces sp. ISL-14]